MTNCLLDPADLNPPAAEAEALAQLAAGQSVILYSALGPSDRVEIDGARRALVPRPRMAGGSGTGA
jgi:hypothetical protein